MGTASQEEKASWTVTDSSTGELILAKCVRIDVRNPTGRVCIVLTLVTDEDSPREVLRYFNALHCRGKNERNECRISKDSNLAKLYRTTLGKNPERYSKAKRLSKRLIGYEFLIDPYPDGQGNSFEYRTQTIEPIHPIKSDQWGNTGKLFAKKPSNQGWRKHIKTGTKAGQLGDKDGTKKGQNGDSEKCEEPHYYLASTINPTTNNQQPVNRTPITTATSTVIEPIYTNVKQLGEKERFFQYQQQPNETTEQYHDRVIDESF